jgi:hypothetical protein
MVCCHLDQGTSSQRLCQFVALQKYSLEVIDSRPETQGLSFLLARRLFARAQFSRTAKPEFLAVITYQAVVG